MVGLSIWFSVPKGESEMRIHSCPSCRAMMYLIVVCARMVNCRHSVSALEPGGKLVTAVATTPPVLEGSPKTTRSVFRKAVRSLYH